MSYIQKFRRFNQFFIVIIMSCIVLSCGDSATAEKENLQRAKDYMESKDLSAAALELKNLLVNNPKNAEARYLLGSVRLALGDVAAAEKETRRALDAGWNEAQAKQQLAVSLLRLGKFKELLDEARVKDNYAKEIQAELLGLRAAAYVSQDQWEDAVVEIAAGENISAQALWVLKSKTRIALHDEDIAALKTIMEKALTLYPDDRDLLLLSAAIAAEDKNLDIASLTLNKVIDLEPARLMTQWGRQARLFLFRISFKQQDIDTAKTSIEAVLNVYKSDPEANYLGALLAYYQQEYELAEDRLNVVIRERPKHREAILLLGRLNYLQKDFQQAAHYLEQATSARPEDKSAQTLLGKTYSMLGQYDAAERELRSVSSRSADDAELLALVGVVKMKSGDVNTGVEVLEEALLLDPDDNRIRSELVSAYLASDDTASAIKLLEKIDGDGDDGLQFKSMLLLSYVSAGKLDKAHTLADDLAISYPEQAVVYNLKAVVYEAQGNIVAAIERYKKALSIQKDNNRALLSLANIDVTQGNTEKAEERYQSILKRQPDNAKALVALAKLQAIKGQPKEALATLNKAREANPAALEARLILSSFYLSQGDAEKALQLANEAMSIAPNTPKATLAVARAKMVSDKKEALRLLNNLVKYSPKFAEAYFYLAQASALSGDIAGTRSSLERAVELKPTYIKAQVALAEMDLKAGKVDAALEVASKLLTQYPDNTEVYILQGDALLLNKEIDAAMASYQNAAKSSNESVAIIRVGKLYQLQGKSDEGIIELERWLLQHDDNFSVRLMLANLLMTKGDNDSAYKEYSHLYENFSESPVVLNDLAWLKHLRGDTDALTLAERAHRIAPDNPAIQDTYGWILLQSGRAESALMVLQKALDNLPGNPDIRYHYIAALAQTGEKEKAKKELDILLADGNQFSEREGALRLKEQLHSAP